MFLPEPTQREIPPAGNHFARCWQIVDFGTQEGNYQGKPTLRHQVQIGWELPDLLMKDGRCFSQFVTYTWSMGEKANLRKDLESWRGKPFTEEDFRGPDRFNIKKLIGVGCLMNIVHKTSEDGTKTYANVRAISPLPKGFSAPPEPVNKPVYLGLDKDHWDVETFKSLPEWMQQKIEKSPEGKAILLGKSPEPKKTIHEELDDEVPF